MVARMRRADRTDECAVNLRHISMALGEKSDPHWDDLPTGRAFWAAYPRWPRHDTFLLDPSHLLCPARGSKTIGEIDYRGPSQSLRKLEPGDAIATDRPGNHGTGSINVLLRDGSLFPVTETADGWRRAQTTTSD
jgi:hypothetical protein